MAELSLEERLAIVEQQLATILAQQANGSKKRDWRRTVGIFTDNPGMKEFFADGLKIREEDRNKAKQRRTKKRRVQP